ncbi:hypothetical protein CPC08DRAFT_731513 [Agrocybe pediades]|nr:hypothetical protein CPC08DRAFT_731513 [Agrocybe pediades]
MIATAFTLMFLLATTMLPALQKAWIYVACLISKQLLPPPSQCPYKSPQSKAFYALCRWAMRGTAPIFANRLTATIDFHKRVMKVLSESWSDASWQKSDIGWLRLRDALSFADFYNSVPHPIQIPTLDSNYGNGLGIILREFSIRDFSQLPFDAAYPIFDIINGFEDVFSEISKRGLVSQSDGERHLPYQLCQYLRAGHLPAVHVNPRQSYGLPRIPPPLLPVLFGALARRTMKPGKGKSRLGDDDKQGPSLLDFFAGRAIFSTLDNLNDPPMLLHYENLGMHHVPIESEEAQAYCGKSGAGEAPCRDNLQIQLLSTVVTFLHVEAGRICLGSTESYKPDWRNTPFGYRYISNLLLHSTLAMYRLSESTLLPSQATDVDNVVQEILHHIFTGTLHILPRDDDVDSAGVVKTAHRMLFFYVSTITLDCLLAINDGVLLRSHTDTVYVVRGLLRTVKRDIWQKADNGRDFTIETNFRVLLDCPWIQKHALFSETWWKNMDDDPDEPSLSSLKQESCTTSSDYRGGHADVQFRRGCTGSVTGHMSYSQKFMIQTPHSKRLDIAEVMNGKDSYSPGGPTYAALSVTYVTLCQKSPEIEHHAEQLIAGRVWIVASSNLEQHLAT